MNYSSIIWILLVFGILSVVGEPRRGGGGGSRGGGSRGGGSRGGSKGGGGFSSWFSRSPTPVSRPSPVFRPAPAPRPISRPAPTHFHRPASPAHHGQAPPPGWKSPPPAYTRYVPNKAPPPYGAPSFASRPHPPPYTPSVGHNPYNQPRAVASLGASAGGNYPRQTYTPVTSYGYPVVNSGYGYGYSPHRATVINNYYSSPSYYHRSSSSDLLTAYSYYNLGRISGGGGYHPHYYHRHSYYNRHSNQNQTDTSIEQPTPEMPTNTTSNSTTVPISSTVDLTKQPLYETIAIPYDNVSKHTIDYQPMYLNESLVHVPFYGIEHLTWNASDTYIVERDPPPITGLGAQIGNWFYSIISWFSNNHVNENADKGPYEPYFYENEIPASSTTPTPLSAEESLQKLMKWKMCLWENSEEECEHLRDPSFND